MHARRLLAPAAAVTATAALAATAPVACTSPPSLPEQSADASRGFDVQLPDTSVPDSFVITEIGGDAGTTEIDPSATCDAELDGGGGGATGSTAMGRHGSTARASSRRESSETADAGGDDGGDGGDDRGDEDAGAANDAPGGGPPASACETPLVAGDLVFDEAMIASVAGSSDRGQWLEVKSTRACSVNLRGLHASAPHGATARAMDVTTDVWLSPGGFFLIADTLDPAENNDLPGLVLAWTGSPADAIHKTSDTITLSLGTTTLDTLTYPDKARVDGTSMAFPSSCAPTLRADFTDWEPSTASWTPGFFGTPGAPNTDVMCPVPAIPTCTPAARRRGRE